MDFIDLKTPYQALKSSINQRMQTVLEHGQYIMGPEVAELESALAQRTGAAHCITVASGTEALLISLMALGLQAGDEVITTPFTFAATAEAEPIEAKIRKAERDGRFDGNPRANVRDIATAAFDAAEGTGVPLVLMPGRTSSDHTDQMILDQNIVTFTR